MKNQKFATAFVCLSLIFLFVAAWYAIDFYQDAPEKRSGSTRRIDEKGNQHQQNAIVIERQANERQTRLENLKTEDARLKKERELLDKRANEKTTNRNSLRNGNFTNVNSRDLRTKLGSITKR